MLLPSATIISVYNVRALINEWAHYIHTVQCTINRFHQIRIWLKQKKMWFSINVNAKSSNYIKFFNGKYFLFSFFFSVVFLIDESQIGKSKSPEQKKTPSKWHTTISYTWPFAGQKLPPTKSIHLHCIAYTISDDACHDLFQYSIKSSASAIQFRQSQQCILVSVVHHTALHTALSTVVCASTTSVTYRIQLVVWLAITQWSIYDDDIYVRNRSTHFWGLHIFCLLFIFPSIYFVIVAKVLFLHSLFLFRWIRVFSLCTR